jgi:WD40 repeat protein
MSHLITLLPPEIWKCILSQTAIREIASVSSVCKKFNMWMHSEEVIREIFKRNCLKIPDPFSDWKDFLSNHLTQIVRDNFLTNSFRNSHLKNTYLNVDVLRLTHNGKLILGGKEEVKIWKISKEVCDSTIPMPQEHIKALELNRAQDKLYVGCSAGKVHVIDLKNVKIIETIDLSVQKVSRISAIALSPDQLKLAIASGNNIQILDLATKTLTKDLFIANYKVTSLLFTQNSIFSGHAGDSIKNWDFDSKKGEELGITIFHSQRSERPQILALQQLDADLILAIKSDGLLKISNSDCTLEKLIILNHGFKRVAIEKNGKIVLLVQKNKIVILDANHDD